MKTRYILSCLLLGGTLSVSAQKMAVKSNLLSAANGALNSARSVYHSADGRKEIA